ncbi:MAG: MATE family efflux transporter, partial [Bacillota bacterium]|nr:MATE family efflux transporter [Bacillota bacterium]
MDPIFIEVLGFGIKGAAIATIIGQTLGFMYVMNYFYRGNSNFKIMPHHLKPNFEYIKEIFSVGFPTFMRNVAGSVLAIVANNSLGYYGGDIALSVYGVIQRVLRFALMPMFGIVQGFQPIASYNYGAENFERVKEVIKVALKALVIYATISIIMVQLFPELIISLFNKDSELISLGKNALRIVTIMMPLIGVQVLAGSMYQALGKPKPALIVSMSRQTLFLIPLILVLPSFFNMGLMGVYWAFPIADALSIILSSYMLRRQMKILDKKILLEK